MSGRQRWLRDSFLPVVDSRSLAATFRAEIAGCGGSLELWADSELGSVLVAACVRGRSAFAHVALDDLTFVRYLAKIVEKEALDRTAVSALPLEDLYLACACLEGCAEAVTIFAARYRGTIRDSIGGIISSAESEDVREQLMQALLVGSPTGPPKIGTYSGRAALERWLGVAARRAALMWLRQNQTEMRVRRASAADPIARDNGSLETAYIKERYRGEFEEALSKAFARLPERQRLLLRLYMVNGVTVERIGTMFKVGKATVSRWMAAARSALLDDIKQTLRNRLGTSSEELASLARMVASRLEVTLPIVLRMP
jgi:RNA polymerase sigma-70 factor (ECF subfamily)